MLPAWPEAPERALLLDTLARINPEGRTTEEASYAQEAATLYRELYAGSGSRHYARAYDRLTGSVDGLPSVPPLPRLARHIDSGPVVLDALFTRVEELTAAAAPRTDEV